MKLGKNEAVLLQESKAKQYYWFEIFIVICAIIGAIYLTLAWPQIMPRMMLNERTTVLMRMTSVILLIGFPLAALIFWLESKGSFIFTDKRIIIQGRGKNESSELRLSQVVRIELTSSLIEAIAGCQSLSVFFADDEAPPVHIGPFSRTTAQKIYSEISKHLVKE